MLLVAVLLTGLTTFMFLPLLAVDLTARGIAASATGFLVGLLSFSSQGFSLATGFLLDRLGSGRVLIAGFLLRIAGYLLLALAHGRQLTPLIAGIVAIGVGGSLLGLAVKTMLVTAPSASPRAMLALRSTFVNLGVVLGPVLGALTYRAGFRFILGACVLSHLVLAGWLAREQRSADVWPAALAADVGSAPDGSTQTFGDDIADDDQHEAGALRTRAITRLSTWRTSSWIVLCAVDIAYWAIYGQLNAVVPVAARAITGSSIAISVVFTVNGVLVVCCQYVLLQRVFRRAEPRTLLILGFLSFMLAYVVLAPEAGWLSVLCYVVPVTLAEMLIGPSLDEQVVRVVPPHRTGRALGTLGAGAACGSLLGASLGGALFQALTGRFTVWLVVAAAAVGAAGLSALLPRNLERHA